MAKRSLVSRFGFYAIFVLVCAYVFVYPLVRLSNWYSPGLINGWQALAIWLVSVSGFLYSFNGPKMVVRYFMVHWMGASFIFSTLTVIAEVVRLTIDLPDPLLVQLVVVAGLLIILGAVGFSHHLSIKPHEITSQKVSRPYRIAQISDVHIGSRQGGYMRRIVNRLNELGPDFVVITGDLIDSSRVDYEALESLKTIQAPTYFCIGNHERYADLEKILEILERLDVKTLRQERVESSELSFVGIDDADHKDHIAGHLPNIDLNPQTYQVLLYHRPTGWKFAREHGIDLMLSGHTHNGQIFPFNFLVRQQFKRIRGLFVEGDHRLYVSSGTGTWGPLMRLGSMNEISVFNLRPPDK